MVIRIGNARVSVTMDERDQALAAIQKRRADADYFSATMTDVYRGALLNSHYADWTRKPVESMDIIELARFIATYDGSIGDIGSDSLPEFPESTASKDKDAFNKAVRRMHELTANWMI